MMSRIFTPEENRDWSKTLPGKMCSACVIIQRDQKVLMVKAVYKDHWTFPSGVVDENESPKNAAIREAREEVGLVLDGNNYNLFTIVYTASSGEDRDRFNFAYLITVDSKEVALTVPNDEIEDARWVGFADVAALAGGKGSYQKFQEYLLHPSKRTPYTEIYPKS